ncbi:hypothetical protein CLF_109879 [Clonorchis sinensis]|uniref:DUF5738 domain-containing protein n=1 Tax=Clonorchis sinensis TaxID=79923 RepID=H2KUQ6_CLOSI|nr:hypothetical protein CLF_109879 [Clonorchis sinensis]
MNPQNFASHMSVLEVAKQLRVRRMNLLRTPSPSLVAPGIQCGAALVTELDAYQRRIHELIHFIDGIAQHWWDRLYQYKLNLVKRPSKSAEEICFYRNRLWAHIQHFTLRSVVPAASAVATLEQRSAVDKLLPPISVYLSPTAYKLKNDSALLEAASNLARRLGNIEYLKQRLLLSVLTWITSDGRDFGLRAQRVAHLVRYTEPCLIEKFSGIQAVLKQYYRSNQSTANLKIDEKTEVTTASRLSTTNARIMEAVNCVFLQAHQYITIPPTVTPGTWEYLLPAYSPNASRITVFRCIIFYHYHYFDIPIYAVAELRSLGIRPVVPTVSSVAYANRVVSVSFNRPPR